MDECACGCGKSLNTAPSPYFATEACQRAWARTQAGLPALPAGADAAIEHVTSIVRDRRRQREADINYIHTARSAATTWQEIGHTAIPRPYDAARWWSYDNTRAMWELRESDGTNTRALHYIADEAARRLPAGTVEAHLKRRLGGHVPPLPTQYLP